MSPEGLTLIIGDCVNILSQCVSLIFNPSLQGGEIGINIEWKCNLDRNIEECLPKYSFTELDAPFAKNKISKGYNFRYSRKTMKVDLLLFIIHIQRY